MLPFGRNYSESEPLMCIKGSAQNKSISGPNPEGMPCILYVGFLHLLYRYHCADPHEMAMDIRTGALATYVYSYCQFWDQKWSLGTKGLKDYKCECELSQG